MFWVSGVRSAAGAANYFAADNYYTQGENAEASIWGGRGADALGLSGKVDKDTFEALLNSTLPSGEQVNRHENRRAGLDLTFSMPKSASILAYVGGDERILEANRNAVKTAMAWVEKNTAEIRTYEANGKNGDAVRTGNLVYAMFEHDTSRALDPQAHIHVVVAAISQTAAGAWKALWNGEIYKRNSTIGSIYHAALRTEIQKLGYDTRITGKHGQFEIEGVPKAAIKELSQRRNEIVEKAEDLGITSPAGMLEVAKRTRDEKVVVEDHEALKNEWTERAEATGYDAKATVEAAKNRVIGPERTFDLASLRTFVENVRSLIGDYIRNKDPLITQGLERLKLSPTELRTEMAVASALRILGERAASFEKAAIAKTALDLNLPNVTIDRVEARMARLEQLGQIVPGASDRIDGVVTRVTTPEHINLERAVLQEMEQGRGRGHSLMAEGDAAAALTEIDPARLIKPVELTEEQVNAGAKALSSRDRFFIIQGVAGAGKSTLIESMSKVLEDNGRQLLGLAIQTENVKALREGSKIEAQTISSFVHRHIYAAMRGSGPAYERSLGELKNKHLIIDESSFIGTQQMNNLMIIARAFNIEKTSAIGDRDQQLAVEHGQPFALLQAAKADMAVISVSQRQKSEVMKEVATAARNRNIEGAFAALGDRVVAAGANYLERAAEAWLALTPQEREKQDNYTAGRRDRDALNKLIQTGLKAEGTLKGDPVNITTYAKVQLTREEMRYPHNYEPGMRLDVLADGVGNLAKGSYTVLSVNRRGQVFVENPTGKQKSFYPSALPADTKRDLVGLSDPQKIDLYEGDRVRFTEQDKKRDVHKADRATVLKVEDNQVTVRLDNGKTEVLPMGDRLLSTLGLMYALNAHQIQGASQDKAIPSFDPNQTNLATARLFYVIVTRVRYDMQIFTSDPVRLERAISTNMGDRVGALETIGEMTMPKPKDTSQSVRFHVSPNRVMFDNAELRAEPEKHREPQKDVPEKVKERGL